MGKFSNDSWENPNKKSLKKFFVGKPGGIAMPVASLYEFLKKPLEEFFYKLLKEFHNDP